MTELDQLLDTVRTYGTKIMVKFPDRIIYHNFKWAKRLEEFIDMITERAELTEREMTLGKICAWIIASSFESVRFKFEKDGSMSSNDKEEAKKAAQIFFEQHTVKPEIQKEIMDILDESFHPVKPKTNVGKLLHDAITADIVTSGKKSVRKVYEEMIMADVDISKRKWYDIAESFVANLEFNLECCQTELQPDLEKLALDLAKEKKKIDKSSDLALKKELNISEVELKELKKNLQKSKGRDDRGIQTLFRTTSKNHYTLNEMVDRKASIMITVNSIILSLVLGGIIGEINEHGHPHINAETLPIFMLTITAMLSIVFALISIRPTETHGEFTEDEVRNKEGNLLFYGNFHNMAERDFEWAFMQMMNDKDFMYGSMIKDLYYQGQKLAKKYRNIRIALTIFLVGLVLSVVASWIGGIFFEFLGH
ncbi:MAG: hypothetical protein HKN39_05535 [Flavobacteriales bacterium]|nr:hypothetical protein [Flavobacteriales bacterium]